MHTVELVCGLLGGQWYAFWSGIGADIPVIAMILLVRRLIKDGPNW